MLAQYFRLDNLQTLALVNKASLATCIRRKLTYFRYHDENIAYEQCLEFKILPLFYPHEYDVIIDYVTHHDRRFVLQIHTAQDLEKLNHPQIGLIISDLDILRDVRKKTPNIWALLIGLPVHVSNTLFHQIIPHLPNIEVLCMLNTIVLDFAAYLPTTVHYLSIGTLKEAHVPYRYINSPHLRTLHMLGYMVVDFPSRSDKPNLSITNLWFRQYLQFFSYFPNLTTIRFNRLAVLQEDITLIPFFKNITGIILIHINMKTVLTLLQNENLQHIHIFSNDINYDCVRMICKYPRQRVQWASICDIFDKPIIDDCELSNVKRYIFTDRTKSVCKAGPRLIWHLYNMFGEDI